METKKTIAKNVRIAKGRANYDAACKRLLSERTILAGIMKTIWKNIEHTDFVDY